LSRCFFFIDLSLVSIKNNVFFLVPIREEIPRRLKSAPLVRSLPPASILTIPEPRFVTPVVTVSTNQIPQTPPPPATTKPRIRASSAKARLNTTYPASQEQTNEDFKQQRRETKSAQGFRQKEEPKLSDEDCQKTSLQTYSDIIQQQEPSPIPPTPPPPPPAYVYQKSVTWCPSEPPSTPLDKRPLRTTIEINPVALNPYYVHRPGVVSVRNIDKKPVVRENSGLRKTNKHYRRHHQSHHHRRREQRNEPLLALTPISHSTKVPIEIDGINLIYDPTLTIDDPSINLTKYLIEGRLYLIKDQRYNVLENIDPTFIEKYNQTLT
jgi:hypothetical protein